MCVYVPNILRFKTSSFMFFPIFSAARTADAWFGGVKKGKSNTLWCGIPWSNPFTHPPSTSLNSSIRPAFSKALLHASIFISHFTIVGQLAGNVLESDVLDEGPFRVEDLLSLSIWELVLIIRVNLIVTKEHNHHFQYIWHIQNFTQQNQLLRYDLEKQQRVWDLKRLKILTSNLISKGVLWQIMSAYVLVWVPAVSPLLPFLKKLASKLLPIYPFLFFPSLWDLESDVVLFWYGFGLCCPEFSGCLFV